MCLRWSPALDPRLRPHVPLREELGFGFVPAFPFHDAAAGAQDGLLMTPKGSPDNVTSATGPLRRPSHPPAAFNFSRKREMTLGRYFGETRKSDSRSSWRRRCDGCYRADPPGRGEAVSAGRSISQRVSQPKHQDPSVWFAHRCVWAIYQPGGIRQDIEAPSPSCWEGVRTADPCISARFATSGMDISQCPGRAPQPTIGVPRT